MNFRYLGTHSCYSSYWFLAWPLTSMIRIDSGNHAFGTGKNLFCTTLENDVLHDISHLEKTKTPGFLQLQNCVSQSLSRLHYLISCCTYAQEHYQYQEVRKPCQKYFWNHPSNPAPLPKRPHHTRFHKKTGALLTEWDWRSLLFCRLQLPKRLTGNCSSNHPRIFELRWFLPNARMVCWRDIHWAILVMLPFFFWTYLSHIHQTAQLWN